jgi:hypothetical protein
MDDTIGEEVSAVQNTALEDVDYAQDFGSGRTSQYGVDSEINW